MNQQTLANLCKQIYRRFPEVAGCRPKLHDRSDDQVLLIFTGRAKTTDGHTFTRTVRVVASQNGKIIKTSTSR